MNEKNTGGDQQKPNTATTTKAKRTRKKSGGKTKATRKQSQPLSPYKFPKNTLEEALTVAKALDEKYAGNPTKATDLVKAVGFNKETDSRSWTF